MSAKQWRIVIITFLIFIGMCVLLLSCDIIKHTVANKADTSGLHKASTALTDTSNGGSKTTTNNKDASEWWKTTIQYPHDTGHNIVNNNTYPTRVIYEGGTSTKESNVVDSTWFKNALQQLQTQLDSTKSQLEQKTKDVHSETKGVGLVTLIICLAGLFVLILVTNKISLKWKSL